MERKETLGKKQKKLKTDEKHFEEERPPQQLGNNCCPN